MEEQEGRLGIAVILAVSGTAPAELEAEADPTDPEKRRAVRWAQAQDLGRVA